MIRKPWLTIIGLNSDDITSLPEKVIQSLKKAEFILGDKRHITFIKKLNLKGTLFSIKFNTLLQKLFALRRRNVVFLASGDPFWYGAGSIISENFEKNEWFCHQSNSTFSLAASKIGWSIQHTYCFGLHNDSIESIKAYLFESSKFLLLMKNDTQLLKLVDWLKSENLYNSSIIVMESLGYKNERIRYSTIKKYNFDDVKHPICIGLNILDKANYMPLASGKPDHFFLNDGQITKQPIRAVTMSLLVPKPNEHLWDIGSGSGSISIEWSLLHKLNRASAIEKNKKRAKNIKLSAKKFGLQKNITVYNKKFEDILETLEKPDVIFIGGGLNFNTFNLIWNIAPKKTRIVINSVTLETNSLIYSLHDKYGGHLQKIEISNINNLKHKRAWSNKYPIIQWSLTK